VQEVRIEACCCTTSPRPTATRCQPVPRSPRRGTLSRSRSLRYAGLEMDPSRLRQRQKQIDFGKNTRGYEMYITKVPKYGIAARYSTGGNCGRLCLQARAASWRPCHTGQDSGMLEEIF